MDQLYSGITEPTLTTEAERLTAGSSSANQKTWLSVGSQSEVRWMPCTIERLSSITLTLLNRRGGVKIEMRQRRDTGRILAPLRGLIRGQSWAGFNNPLPSAFPCPQGPRPHHCLPWYLVMPRGIYKSPRQIRNLNISQIVWCSPKETQIVTIYLELQWSFIPWGD